MLTGTAEMSTSTLTATLILIEISTATKPSKNYRRGDSLIKGVRVNGSTIRNTVRAFRIATKEPRRNLIGRARRSRCNQESSFVDELNKADKISDGEPQGIAPVSATVEQAKVWAAIREVGEAPFKASIAVVAQRGARASAEAPAGEALAAVGPGLGVAAREVEVEEDDGGSLRCRGVRFQVSGFRFRRMEQWNDGTMEEWNDGILQQRKDGMMEDWINRTFRHGIFQYSIIPLFQILEVDT
jgi:hypothetical protein